MSDSDSALHDYRLSANITQAMFYRLEHIAELRGIPKSELVREAIRHFLDSQEDLAGSRKHFTKAFQRRVDYLDWQLEVLVQMVAYIGAALARRLTEEKGLTAEAFIQYAIQKTLEGEWQADFQQGWLAKALQNRKPPAE